MSKQIHIEMFSEARIALTREVQNNWPELTNQIANSDATDWPDQLGIIAAFCGIAMDGYYSHEQLDTLADKLVFKLRAARSLIITP